jgi:hypothetical protein
MSVLRDSKPLGLFLLGDGKVELEQLDAVLDQHFLEQRHILQEPFVLLVGAEAHHRLDHRSIVPGAVKEYQFAGGGQVRHVPLEIPLGNLAVAGCG